MTGWSDRDSMTAQQLIAFRAASTAIYEWLVNDCFVTDDELVREFTDDFDKGWMDPEVSA